MMSAVWSSLTQKNLADLERVQRAAVRLIIIQPYESYSATLKDLDIMRLSERREIICLSNFEKLFPLHKSEHEMKTRHEDKFQIRRCNSKRFANSAIPNMLKLLNKEHKDQKQQWKKLKKSVTNKLCL